MLIPFGKAKAVLGLLPLIAALGGTPQPVLRIRVSQETSPGAGDFDKNIMGFIEALNTGGTAATFYRMQSARYGNTAPVLTPKTSHIFFVNGSDGVALFVVHNSPNRTDESTWGSAQLRFELSGGTASVLQSDDGGEATSQGGKVFNGNMDWAGANTDGMVVGTLPAGFTLLGQFTAPPQGLNGGWLVISADGMAYPLKLVPGQRVRLDVRLVTDVRPGS